MGRVGFGPTPVREPEWEAREMVQDSLPTSADPLGLDLWRLVFTMEGWDSVCIVGRVRVVCVLGVCGGGQG